MKHRAMHRSLRPLGRSLILEVAFSVTVVACGGYPNDSPPAAETRDGGDGTRSRDSGTPLSDAAAAEDAPAESGDDASTNQGVRSIAVGEDYACAVKAEGSLWCWGRNQYGQLGDGTTSDRPSPVKVASLGNDVAQVAAGMVGTCAVKKDDSVWCWASGKNPTLTPQLKLTKQKSVALGMNHACALSGNGELTCWGNNALGQVGLAEGASGPSAPDAPPTVVLTQVSSVAPGASNTCATRVDKTLWCWGSSYSPVPAPLTNLGGVAIEVSGSGRNRCVRAANQTVWCWGDNATGEVGDGTTLLRAFPVPVSGLPDVLEMWVGTGLSYVRRANGSLWGWGSGTLAPINVNSQVGPDVKVLMGGKRHACLLRNDGSVWCVGDNTFGQMGIGAASAGVPLIRVAGLDR